MIVRIYTDHDGQTHCEELPLPAKESHNVALQTGANLVFRCFPADSWSHWHTAPRRCLAHCQVSEKCKTIVIRHYRG
jgi:hypothetical protein